MTDYSEMTLGELEALAARLSIASATIKEALALMRPPEVAAPAPIPLTSIHAPPPTVHVVAPPAPVSTMRPNPDGTYGPRRSRTPPPANPEHQLTPAEQAEKNLVLAKLKARETA